MSLFDKLIQSGLNKIEIGLNNSIDILENKINDFGKTTCATSVPIATEKRSKKVEKIINTFYLNYPETPYVSEERTYDWIENAKAFSTMIVSIEMMKRFEDNLLPGHIYMLYWLKKYTNKKVPTYFEYKYGIDFEKEKRFLKVNGYLDELNKPTEKGIKAIENHFDVIERHSPKKTGRTIEDVKNQIEAHKQSLIRNGFAEYEFIANRDCCEICKDLNGKHFKVKDLKMGVNAPPMHDGCRCSIASYEDTEEYDAWLDYLSKGGTTKQWEKLKKKNRN